MRLTAYGDGDARAPGDRGVGIMKSTLCAVLIGVSVVARGVGAQSGFLTFGSAPGESNVLSGMRMSASGKTVTGWASAGFVGGPFVWTRETGLRPIPPYNDAQFFYEPSAVSPSGTWAVRDWAWEREADSTVSLGPTSNGLGAAMLAVADNGFAVGYQIVERRGPFGQQSTRLPATWTPTEGVSVLPPFVPGDEDPQFRAVQILADGRLVVVSADDSWQFIYTMGEGYEELVGAPLGLMDPTGSVVVGSRFVGIGPDGFPDNEAVVWTPEGEFILAPIVPGEGAGAFSISDDLRFILGGTDSVVPVVWVDREGPVDLIAYAMNRGVDLSGYRFFGQTFMSSDSRIFVNGQVNRFGDPDWTPGRVDIGVLTLEPCPADVNFDGLLLPDDFTEWVRRFNDGHIRCDQNGDGRCDGSDFFVWVVGYTAGCP